MEKECQREYQIVCVQFYSWVIDGGGDVFGKFSINKISHACLHQVVMNYPIVPTQCFLHHGEKERES